MTPPRSRPGYVFLMTVLFTGAIALAAVSSMLLLSWASEQSGLTFAETNQSVQLANSCAEFALRRLRLNPMYPGSDTLLFDKRGSCNILPIKQGTVSRIICVEGLSGKTTRRLRINIQNLYPSVVVSSYYESLDMSACQ